MMPFRLRQVLQLQRVKSGVFETVAGETQNTADMADSWFSGSDSGVRDDGAEPRNLGSKVAFRLCFVDVSGAEICDDYKLRSTTALGKMFNVWQQKHGIREDDIVFVLGESGQA